MGNITGHDSLMTHGTLTKYQEVTWTTYSDNQDIHITTLRTSQ